MAKDLWDMSDEEAEAAFMQAKEEIGGGEIEYSTTSDEVSNDGDYTEDSTEDTVEDTVEVEESVESNEETTEVDEDSTGDNDLEDPEVADDEQPDEDLTSVTNDAPKIIQPELPKFTKIKANGLEYEFTQAEMLKQFPMVFSQAMDYTKKMSKIKPYTKMINAIETEGLREEDVNLMIDVFKGSKEAFAAVAKRNNIDVFDIDTTAEKVYRPNEYGQSASSLELQDIVGRIGNDPEYTRTKTIIQSDWDDDSWAQISKNPTIVEQLHIDVKSGIFDKVQPIANTLKLSDGGRSRKTDLDWYGEAARVYVNRMQTQLGTEWNNRTQQAKVAKVNEVAKQQQQRQATAAASVKRKAATVPKKLGTNVVNNTITDYLNASDDEWQKWYDKMEGSR